MKQYLDLLQDILDNGVESEDRTGTGTLSVFGRQMRFDLSKGFPLLTTKKLHFKSIAIELLWFLQGNTNTEYLVDNGVRIWNEWAEKEDVLEEKKLDYLERFAIGADMGHRETIRGLDLNNKEVVDATLKELNVPETIRCKVRDKGDLGPIYGKQWRKWTVIRRADSLSLLSEYEESRFTDAGFSCLDSTPINSFWGKTVDQISEVIKSIKENPYSRRHIVNAWNVGELELMNLVPCFLPGTLVATRHGYKPIETITDNDSVINSKGFLEPVNQKHTSDYLGELVTIKTYTSNEEIVCTKNHKFVTKENEAVRADELTKDDYLLIPRSKIKDEAPSYSYVHNINFNKRIEKNVSELREDSLTVDEMWVLGYFVGNGWFLRSTNTVNFSVPTDKVERILPKLRGFVKVCEKKMDSDTCKTFLTITLKYRHMFKSFGHLAHNKLIPEWILNSPLEYQQSFFDGYVEADGCITNKSGTINITTVSPSLAYGIQRLCVNLNKYSRINKQIRPETTIIEGRVVNQRDTYSITIPTRTPIEHFFDERGLWVKIKDVIKSEEGFYQVHNLDVGYDHTYTVNNYSTHNCHYTFQFYVREGKLSCMWTQRSVDSFLGLPFNIASYALLTHMIAHLCGLEVGELIFSGGDVHVYTNHLEQVKEQLARSCKDLPTLAFARDVKDIDDFRFEDFIINNYEAHPHIKGKVAI